MIFSLHVQVDGVLFSSEPMVVDKTAAYLRAHPARFLVVWREGFGEDIPIGWMVDDRIEQPKDAAPSTYSEGAVQALAAIQQALADVPVQVPPIETPPPPVDVLINKNRALSERVDAVEEVVRSISNEMAKRNGNIDCVVEAAREVARYPWRRPPISQGAYRGIIELRTALARLDR